MSFPDDDRRLFFLLDRAAHAFRERIDAMCRARLGVSAVQLVALLHIARADGLRPGELAAALGTRAGAVTGLVDRMEAAGLVKRRADRDDARVQRLHVTAAGRHAIDSAKPVVAAANRLLAQRFSSDELATAARFLRAVADLDWESLVPSGEQP